MSHFPQMTKAVFVLIALGGFVAGPARAGDDQKKGEGSGSNVEKSAGPRKDGGEKKPANRQIAAKKAAEARLNRLLREHPEADTNKDGKISTDEEQEWARKDQAQRLEKLLKEHPEADTNKDGKISSVEAAEYRKKNPPLPEGKQLEAMLKRFPEIDKNKDGKISKEEMSEFQKSQAEKRKNNPPEKGKRRGPARGQKSEASGKETGSPEKQDK